MFAALLALFIAPGGVRAAAPAPPASGPSVSATPAFPPPAPVPVSPGRAAAFAAAMVSGLLLLLYAHRRQPFILLWAAGWLLMAPHMLLVARGYERAWIGREAVGLSQLLDVGTSVLFLWSADVYRGTGYVTRAHLKPLGWLAAWFIVMPLVFGTGTVIVPGHLAAAALLVGAGSMYAAVLLERRMIGAGLVAFVLFGLAIANLPSAFAASRTFAMTPALFDILILKTVLYASGALGVHLLVFEDMTYELRVTNRRLQAAREELLQAAITDPLTGCHNRRFFDTVIDRELRRHDRFRLPLSLLFVDLNRFKTINDTLGHDVGDRVLQYVARFLKRHIREADYVFRWGGDEFLILITCTGEEARKKAGGLKASFDAAPEAAELPPGLGLSVGWTEVPNGTTDLTPLVKEADERMYRDKGARAARRR